MVISMQILLMHLPRRLAGNNANVFCVAIIVVEFLYALCYGALILSKEAGGRQILQTFLRHRSIVEVVGITTFYRSESTLFVAAREKRQNDKAESRPRASRSRSPKHERQQDS